MAAAGSSMQSLRDEASCPICLDYLKHPIMIIKCGHNFCLDCLAWHCDAQGAGALRCPQCRERIDQRLFRENRQLANFVEITKQLSLEAQIGRGGGGRGAECEKHQEPLKLFCKDDQALICVVCRESRAHRTHTVLPMEEAAEEYKDWIRSQTDALKKKKDEIVVSKRNGKMEIQALLNQTDNIRQYMGAEFKQLYHLIGKQRLLLLVWLKELDNRIVKRGNEHNAKLCDECASLDNLIQKMEEKRHQPASEFLQGIKGLMQKCETGTVQKSVSFPPELKRWVKRFTDINLFLQHVVRQFRDTLLAEYQLGKDTAHPDLSLKVKGV